MTELTEEQKKKVDNLYREKHWPIKKIAKELHIGDKRVSAFLNGKKMNPAASKPAKGCCKHESQQEVLLGKLIRGMSKSAETESKDFIASLLGAVLDIVTEVVEAKKFNRKVWDKRGRKLLASFGLASSAVSAFSLFAMPKSFKKSFINCIDVENPHYRKLKVAKKQN